MRQDDAGKGRLASVLTWPIGHPIPALAVTFVLALLAAISTSQMRVNGSLAAMFPEHDRAAEAMIHVLDDFPAADQLLVLVSLPPSAPGRDPQRLIDFGHRFVEAANRSPELSNLTNGIYYRPDAQSREFVEKVVAPSAMFYLSDKDFAAAKQRLSREEIQRQIAQDKAILSAPGPAAQAMSKLMRVDPLRLHEFITGLLKSQQPFHTDPSTDAFVSPDGRSLLIRVIGKEPPSNLDYARAITSAVETTAASANMDGLTLQFTGSYPIAALSEKAIRHDMIGSVIGSVVLLQALFLLAYRSPFKLFALAFGPVALGILLGFGLYAVLPGGLTPLTAVLGAILAGMGIDYSIQYISYFESRRAIGRSPRQAAEETAVNMSPAVLAAWATSVVGFVAIGWSRLRALRDFALLGTLGLTGAFLCAAAVLPVILMLSDRRPDPAQTRLRFGAGGLLKLLLRRRGTFLAICFIASAGAAIIVARSGGDVLPLETDLTIMHPQPNPAIDAQYDVAREFGVSPGSLAVYLNAKDSRDLLQLSYKVRERLSSPMAKDAGVIGTYGLATLLPNPAFASARAADFPPGEVNQVIGSFHQALIDNGFDPAAFAGYSQFLRVLLSQRIAPGISDLLPYRDLAETVLPSSALQGRVATEAMTLVFVSGAIDENRVQRDQTIAAVREALSGIDGATVTGFTVVAHDTEQTVRSELPRLILAALVIVALYLAVHFRNLADAALSLLPAGFGLLTAAAVLRLIGQKLNMVNLVAVPLLIGIDVDYGIFLVTLSRFRQVRKQNAPELARQINPACHAVLICATATVLGYVSLIWTSVPAERSLGIAAAVGVAACGIGAIFLLIPLFFTLAGKIREHRRE